MQKAFRHSFSNRKSFTAFNYEIFINHHYQTVLYYGSRGVYLKYSADLYKSESYACCWISWQFPKAVASCSSLSRNELLLCIDCLVMIICCGTLPLYHQTIHLKAGNSTTSLVYATYHQPFSFSNIFYNFTPCVSIIIRAYSGNTASW